MFSENDLKRFWSKVKMGNPNECWPWLGAKDKNGYGKWIIKINGKWVDIRSHRAAWMIEHGKNIPKGLVIMHMCDSPSCCNAKDHLKIGTTKDNAQDMKIKGRSTKGKPCSEEHKNKISLANIGRKLTEEAKLRISIANTGKKSFLGKNHSEETKEKLRKINTGKKLSKEIKIKIGLGGLGRKHSEETKAKMRASWDARKLKASQS